MYATHAAVSRDQIRKRTKAQWEKLSGHFQPPSSICHKGPLDLEELELAMNGGGPRAEEADVGVGRDISGGAMEHLQHVVFGGQPLMMPRYTQEGWCSNFIKDCPGSPCTSNETRNAVLDAIHPWNGPAIKEWMRYGCDVLGKKDMQDWCDNSPD